MSSQVPIIRRFTSAIPAALNVETVSTDDETGQAFLRVTGGTAILDAINDPDPAAGLRYEIRINKGGIDTGRRLYTTGMSAASAGRMGVGVIKLSSGDYYFRVLQRAGALAALSWCLKLASTP